MKNIVLFTLIVASLAQAEPVFTVAELKDAEPLPESFQVVVQPGEIVPLQLKLLGSVAQGDAVLPVRFERKVYFRFLGQQEPQFSVDGERWGGVRHMFKGSLSVGCGSKGSSVELKVNPR
ncbi:hypothetical protein IV102_21925 [bacterium]|nr:hypothetical protein [bacterium]